MTACGSVCVRVKCSLNTVYLLVEWTCASTKFKTGRTESFKRKETCSACKMHRCVELLSIECVGLRDMSTKLIYATRTVIMRKPSRCWLGAVPRYWKVVASCFRFISFAENTSAALAPRAGISQPILLLFFCFLLLNLSTKHCLRFFLFGLKI